MRRFQPKKVYSHIDQDTCFVSTDPKISLVVFEAIKDKLGKDLTTFRKDVLNDFKETIKEIKAEINE
jgi:hypothetical protein